LAGLCPGPLWESLEHCPVLIAGLRGPSSKVEGRRGRGERERKGERKFLDPPLLAFVIHKVDS